MSTALSYELTANNDVSCTVADAGSKGFIWWYGACVTGEREKFMIYNIYLKWWVNIFSWLKHNAKYLGFFWRVISNKNFFQYRSKPWQVYTSLLWKARLIMWPHQWLQNKQQLDKNLNSQIYAFRRNDQHHAVIFFYTKT